MQPDSIKKLKINIDAASGKASKVIIVNNDTIADINIMKSDSAPGLIINGPGFDSKLLPSSGMSLAYAIYPLITFCFIAVVTWFTLRFFQRRNEMRHRERMAAIERGLILPPETASNVDPKLLKQYNPYKWPLILGLCGVAIIVAHLIEGERDFGFGLMLVAIGAALFLSRMMRRNELKRTGSIPSQYSSQPPTPPSPPEFKS